MSGVLIAILAIATACSSPSAERVDRIESPTGAVEAKVAHGLEQDAIRQCMLTKGFPYVGPPFVDWGAHVAATGRIRLVEADSFGYGGVFEALEFLVPSGEPSSDVAPEEYSAYAEALNGVNLQHSHDGTDDHDDPRHNGDAHDHGCYAAAREAVAGVEIIEGERDITKVAARLFASDEYRKFASTWSACLSESGFSLRADNPVEHAEMATSSYFDRAHRRMGEVFASGQSEIYSAQYRSHDQLNLEWFQAMVSEDAELVELHSIEVAEAGADRKCRSDSIQAIETLLVDFERSS